VELVRALRHGKALDTLSFHVATKSIESSAILLDDLVRRHQKKMDQVRAVPLGKSTIIVIVIIVFAFENFFLLKTQTEICLFTIVVAGIAIPTGLQVHLKILNCHSIVGG
jgi:hypothetical protein